MPHRDWKLRIQDILESIEGGAKLCLGHEL